MGRGGGRRRSRGCGGGSGGRVRAARRLRNKKITIFPRIPKIIKNYQKSLNVETFFEKRQKSMIFEELRIFGRHRQLLDEQLPHIDLFSSLYDPKMVPRRPLRPLRLYEAPRSNLDKYYS